ncbi:poly-beta-1,6 N-acetyl-D-glucosamine export porin PgaA [Luteimonas gilva]|uniref:Poly-beta-1,6 N-acetyl-D-glucosamine export porin PgaA n=1 Tax=Luteimonas gilva TaxID=2572684 RepID=A0A4U5JXS8_9GAMM|nr:poly-beta-1,6 N-acetyl-D-glucosamine export porin PgaA [Luteimonas gilva]TKR33027.1 poly-beta-1,6 N-acetyl-D-glucosamine export porin PgaA [Luteimonas gilva]
MPIARPAPLALASLLALSAFSGPSTAGSDAARPSGLQDSLTEIRHLRDQRQWLPALALIEKAAAAHPDDASLYVLRVHTLSELGARDRAWTLYRVRPELFGAEEAQRIEADRLARMTSWSRLYVADEKHLLDQAQATDRASQDYLARADIDPARLPLRLRLDRLNLLNRLARHQEVADDYARLQQEGQTVPGYALAAVGDSLMALQRPEQAETVLADALKADPGNIDLQVQHAYALMESERFDLALPEFKALVDANPAWPYAAGSPRPYDNWKRYEAETNYAMARSYGEDLAGAQAMLEPLAAIGPNNAGLQSMLGSVYERRGWNERALERHRMAATIDPQTIQGRVGQVETLMELQRNDLARPIHENLQASHGDALPVKLADKRWNLHQGWQWRVYAGSGRSRGGGGVSPLGNRDAIYGFDIESPLLDDRWRLTAGSVDRSSEFLGDNVHDRRAAIGLRYGFDRLSWHLQANRSFDDIDDTGLSFDLGWRFNDVLDASFGLRKNDPEASLQARRSGIAADSASLGLDYHPSELTRLTGTAQRLRYDDGNRRDSLALDLDQRLLTRPHFLLDGLASVGASRGSRDDAAYFNPSRDRSWEIGLRADQIVWRRYDRHFRHRLTASAGQYWQEGFGNAWMPSLRYEHEWRFDLGKTLVYGVNWSRPVYDGQRERHLGFDAEFRWGE